MLVIKRPAGTVIKESNRTYIKTGSATFFDEAYGHMNGPAYSSPNANTIHNSQYATNGDHPTDMVVAMTGSVPVYMDQVTLVGSSSSVTAKVPENTVKRPVYSADTDGHVFGYGTCMWLRKCDQAGEIMGSSCSATLSNVKYSGYCFYSDTSSLECGFLSASDDEYGEKPISFDVSISPNTLPSVAGVVDVEGAAPATTFVASTPGVGPVHRCQTGSPAKTLGSFVSKRPLSAGCMITSDPSYDSIAEVHVPDYCSVPADYKPGCMLPSASNFDPTAKQIGKCKFPTKGCSSATALNYNSYATLPPDAGKECIEPVTGCTVDSTPYAGVSANTPGFSSGFYGSGAGAPSGSGGWKARKVAEGSTATTSGTNVLATPFVGAAVVSYNANANVNSGCIVAVEGCMDATARNYDPLATINSGTWCIPDVSGCMVPSPDYASTSYSTVQLTSAWFGKTPNEPTVTWSSTITRHVPSMCSALRFGCMNATQVNYDPLATAPSDCFNPTFGCLNPAAVNFGCPGLDFTAPCRDRLTLPANGFGAPRYETTYHLKALCKWSNLSPPPSPPPMPAPPGATAAHSVDVLMTASGTKADIDAQSVTLCASMATMFGVDASTVSLSTVEIAALARRQLRGRELSTTVDMTFSVAAADAAAADALHGTVSTSLADATAASDLLGVPVLTAPKPTVVVEYTAAATTEASNAGMIGGIVGGIVGALLLIGGATLCYFRSKKNKPVYPA